MTVTVVVGGQYGSEAKGKLVAYLANTGDYRWAVRTGGPNAGHTIQTKDFKHVSRQLPSAYLNPRVKLLIGAGGIVDLRVLDEEIASLLSKGIAITPRLWVDTEAVVVTEDMVLGEKSHSLGQSIGSTETGTGIASIRKMFRLNQYASLIRHVRPSNISTCNAAEMIHEALCCGEGVILEGTQGFGLSLHHSGHWPHCTSRDTTASAVCSEAGVAPHNVGEVFLVFRTFPIRVGGNSGPLPHETTWRDVYERANYPNPGEVREITSVTKKVRRVGEFDWDLARRAIIANAPTAVALHGMDYLDYNNYGVTTWEGLNSKAKSFVAQFESKLNVPVRFLFTGPLQEHLIDLGE